MSPRSWRYALAVLCLAPVSAGAAQRDWIGSARCGSCHPAQLAAWRATAHARPFATAGRATAACLGCHATGEAPAGPVIELFVGCEACHGAGADYATDDVMRNRRLALDLGLVDLSSGTSAGTSAAPARAALCAGCHRAVAMRPGVDPAGPSGPSRLARPAHPPIANSPPAHPAGTAGTSP